MTSYNNKHGEILSFIERYESNARTYARTFSRVFQRGHLASVWDIDGKQYLDFLACAGALPLGHNHPVAIEAVKKFLESGHILQALDMPTVAKSSFLEELLQCLPAGFVENAKVQFCGPTGADAVEAAVKLFKTVTGRRSVIAFHGAYHGMTMGALSLMGNLGPKERISGFMPETHFFPYPNSTRCPFGLRGDEGEKASLTYLDSVLSDPESGITKPALIILEAVQGEGGCIPASSAWLRGVRKISVAHDVPLVIDEVQTGFGRTGSMFAIEESGVTPDALILSKALGGGFPLAVLAYNKAYDKWNPGAHAGTFRGNQIALVSGAATMKHIRESGLLEAVRATGKYLMAELIKLRSNYRCLGDVRGRGLMIGVEIIDQVTGSTSDPPPLDGHLAKAIKAECFQRGLIIETGGRFGAVLRFLPPLITTTDQVDTALQILVEAIEAATEIRCAA